MTITIAEIDGPAVKQSDRGEGGKSKRLCPMSLFQVPETERRPTRKPRNRGVSREGATKAGAGC